MFEKKTDLKMRALLIQFRALLVSLLVLLFCAACTEDDAEPNEADGGALPAQCSADGYVAFDSANHQNQDIRLSVYAQMNSWMNEAKADFTLAADRFGQAKAFYLDPAASANFQEKVQGRTDDHLADSPLQGDYLDATILYWLDKGIAATSNLEASVAKQWVDKTFTHFFFLSVYHEMVDGSRAHWDEAFGYFGSSSTNAEADLVGLAQTAFKRDSTNGTNLNAEIFNNLIDGSCELEKALLSANVEQLDWTTQPALSGIIGQIDIKMQQVLAYSAGHEAFEMQLVIDGGFDPADAADTDEMWIKMAELAPFFEPLGRLMEAAGGESATRAAQIRALIGGADFSDLTAIEWMSDFATGTGGISGAQQIIDLLEAEFNIDIKG